MFRVGDEVVNAMFGLGTVLNDRDKNNLKFPVVVYFWQADGFRRFTEEGKFFGTDKHISLFVKKSKNCSKGGLKCI